MCVHNHGVMYAHISPLGHVWPSGVVKEITVYDEGKPMITREQLNTAAFWERDICLDCGAAGEDLDPVCACGGKVYLAAEVLEILGKVEGEDALRWPF